MSLLDKCCDLCKHSKENPCIDFIPCRVNGPLCHSNEICLSKKKQSLDNLLYGDYGLRISIGMSTCGLASGAQAVYDKLQEELKQRSLNAKLVKTGCMGACYAEVIVEINKPGYPEVIYNNVTPDKIGKILDTYLQGDVSNAYALRSRKGKMKGEETVPLLNELDFFKIQVRDALQNCGVIDPESIDEYILTGGYLALTKVLKSMKSTDVINEVTASKLRGRGGAGFPTGLKWQLCAQVKNDVKYMICNADEGDPGAFMNRLTAEGDPHRVLEGLIIAAYAIGATEGYIFVRAEKPLMAERLRQAIAAAEAIGLLGQNILGSSFSFNVKTMVSAGAFVCGEETALMAAIEGRRAMPRPRPPFPATQGLWNKPTTINNVETLSHVPSIITIGAKEYSKIGTEKSKGTKVFCLAGKVLRTGAAEVPLGTTLRQMVFDIGGGIATGKKFKAIQNGGPSGGCLSENFLDVPMDYETLQQVGAIMGSGGIVVVDEDNCIVDLARYFLTFTTAESCGKCTPCREGLKTMLDILTRITEGKGQEKDIDQLQQLGSVIIDSSLCALGRTGPNPVLTTIKYFRDEYDAHIRDKRCIAHSCISLVKHYQVISERCKSCGLCIKECPSEAIAFDVSKKAVITFDKCIKCGRCFIVCPFTAIERLW